MRKVIVAAFVSLDGVMQAPGGPWEDPTGGFEYGGWLVPFFDEATGEVMERLFSQPYDLLLGRKTYEIFAAYWPQRADEIGSSFNAVTKYVASRSDFPLSWDRSVLLKDAVEDVRRLKGQDGPALLTQGSSVLVQSLLAADLVDELTLFTFPLTLGGGKKLFAGGIAASFDLADHAVSGKGVLIAHYRRAGAVRTAEFEPDNPNQAELARREKMKREG